MKLLLLSDTYSEHTEKWALGLAEKGVEVGIFSFNKASYPWYDKPGIKVFFEPDEKINAESTFTKISYFKYVGILRRIIRNFKPDILHAHYATSYGLIGALSGFHPFVLSVWGTDVFAFPRRTKLHKRIFQFNLKKADVLMSTSEVMRTELAKYTLKNIVVTPFGVDTKVFSKKVPTIPSNDCLHIGTIKPIEDIYGIATIISSAEALVKKYPDKKLKFWLIGPGELEKYKIQIAEKGLTSHFEVTGRIPFEKIDDYHNRLDVFLNVSIVEESFGVAAVEAMACEKPVIVTDAPGLMEITDKGKFGIVIPKGNTGALTEAIEKLMNDANYADELGKKARQRVLERYDWNNNLELMFSEYKKLLK
jgi:glycosyltransferase involved in cell wall biosynthesis